MIILCKTAKLGNFINWVDIKSNWLTWKYITSLVLSVFHAAIAKIEKVF